MQCPKCKSTMEQVPTPFGEVERCISCKGLWLDHFEHDDILQIAEGVDVGSAEAGKEYNRIDDIKCPACANSKLLRLVDNAQPHIWFESCPTCYGRFYDAGELTDLSQLTLSDFIKRLSGKERK